MSADPYSQAVRDLFADPGHAGIVADGVCVQVNDQQVRVELSASLAGSSIRVMRFRVWGCPHLIAAAEWVCQNLEGKSVEALEDLLVARIMEDLAVPVEKTGRILVLEDAIQSLGRSLIH